MRNKNNRLERLSKEEVREAVDIIKNTEDDEAAIAFLQDTLTDDFPDLDLGRMDLHEAIEILGGSEVKKFEVPKEKGDRNAIESLNDSIGVFLNNQEQRLKKIKNKRK